MPNHVAAARAGLIEGLIPKPPADVSALRAAFSKTVANQWRRYVPSALGDAPLGLDREQAVKVHFLAEMYARACYSMLLVSARGPSCSVCRSELQQACQSIEGRRSVLAAVFCHSWSISCQGPSIDSWR